MESYEENSLPYIDDTLSDEDETTPHQYNLKIIENYHNKNRNIEIMNRFPKDTRNPLSPAAPLADETEFSDNKLSDSLEEETGQHVRKPTPKDSGMKLVIKGWNSSISIQGLDNKSSITFKRRCEKAHRKVERSEERNRSVDTDAKSTEKSRKGKWKMLTKSIMLAKSTRFERRGLDERYPKYVLLKNEEEELTQIKENYPKMFVFNEKSTKQKTNAESKPEFSFKKSFKNKTEPIVLTKSENNEQRTKPKKSLTARNLTVKKKVVVERRKNLTTEKKLEQNEGCPLTHGLIYNEIQDIFEDTLNVLPQGNETQTPQTLEEVQQQQRLEYFNSAPFQFCHLSGHDAYCCLPPHNQPPKHTPVCTASNGHVYTTPDTQTKFRNQETETEEPTKREVDFEKLQFGILSSFFPRVVIMNTIPGGEFKVEEEIQKETEFKNYELPKAESVKDLDGDDERPTESLEVPRQDLTLKSKMVQEVVKPEPVMENFCLGDVTLGEFACLDEDQGNKSQGSEATEYLHYTEFDAPGNESVERTKPPSPSSCYKMKEKEDKKLPVVDKYKIEDVDEYSGNLSLTKIGYKMYDNLTKLSLNREKEITKKAEVSGCGCNGNGTKKSPYNITLESNNSVVKVTVPENELNFQIVNSEEGDIQIGVVSGGKIKEQEREEKKIVRKEELWHPDDGRRAPLLQRKGEVNGSSSKASQTFTVSFADNRELVFSIETNKKGKTGKKSKEKSTKEMKVGTDDLDLAGGDFVCALGGNYKNLSPRLGQLLKHLHEKLETDQKERKFLDEKISQKLIDQNFQKGILPGVFLVKQISPRVPAAIKPSEISTFEKPKSDTEKRTGQLREYYCEECLATMRMYEDANPSVKSMVDKFETIIQLEGY